MSQLRFGSVPKQFSQLPGVTSSQAACASRLGAWRDRVLRHVPAHRESDTVSGHYLEYSVKTYCGVLAAPPVTKQTRRDPIWQALRSLKAV